MRASMLTATQRHITIIVSVSVIVLALYHRHCAGKCLWPSLDKRAAWKYAHLGNACWTWHQYTKIPSEFACQSASLYVENPDKDLHQSYAHALTIRHSPDGVPPLHWYHRTWPCGVRQPGAYELRPLYASLLHGAVMFLVLLEVSFVVLRVSHAWERLHHDCPHARLQNSKIWKVPAACWSRRYNCEK